MKERRTEKKRARDFTLQPNHMVCSGEGGGSGVWFDTYRVWRADTVDRSSIYVYSQYLSLEQNSALLKVESCFVSCHLLEHCTQGNNFTTSLQFPPNESLTA